MNRQTAVEARCVAVADTLVPNYRNGSRAYSCAGHVAKMWQAAYDGAAAVLADPLPADVRRLVIAARRATDSDGGAGELSFLLDAVEAFSSRVPYKEEPDDMPAAPQVEALTSGEGKRATWLRDHLHYLIQFYIYAEATKEDVQSVINGLSESDAFDDKVAALVQMPRWCGQDEAQEAVDRHFASPKATATVSAREDFLSQLRRVNTDRYNAWVGDGEDAGILFDAAELGGEVGELLNVVKKLEREVRGWRGSRAAPKDFADECADVLICLDKLARRQDVDLAAATVAKFNATSDKVGLPHKLALTDRGTAASIGGEWG